MPSEDLVFNALDGRPLAATLYDPEGPVRGAVVVFGALGVLRRYYAPFANWLAKRGVVQDHDQVFAVGFDRSGKVEWARAIDQVRATQVRGALGWQGAAMFVLEVPAGEGRALALLRISGSGDADIRVEQLEGSEGKRSAGFVQGAATPEILIADTLGSLSWQRLAVSP